MKLRKEIFDWIVSQGILLKCDSFDNSADTVELTTASTHGLQNGTLLFELFIELNRKLKNATLTDQITRVRLLKSQARPTIRSNYQNLAPLFRTFDISLTDQQLFKIANSGLFSISFLLFVIPSLLLFFPCR